MMMMMMMMMIVFKEFGGKYTSYNEGRSYGAMLVKIC